MKKYNTFWRSFFIVVFAISFVNNIFYFYELNRYGEILIFSRELPIYIDVLMKVEIVFLCIIFFLSLIIMPIMIYIRKKTHDRTTFISAKFCLYMATICSLFHAFTYFPIYFTHYFEILGSLIYYCPYRALAEVFYMVTLVLGFLYFLIADMKNVIIYLFNFLSEHYRYIKLYLKIFFALLLVIATIAFQIYYFSPWSPSAFYFGLKSDQDAFAICIALHTLLFFIVAVLYSVTKKMVGKEHINNLILKLVCLLAVMTIVAIIEFNLFGTTLLRFYDSDWNAINPLSYAFILNLIIFIIGGKILRC